MRPVFPQAAILFQQSLERGRAIALPPCEQDHVMRPFHRIDAVDLHEPDPVNQGQKISPLGRPFGCLGQRMTMQEQTARGGIGQQG